MNPLYSSRQTCWWDQVKPFPPQKQGQLLVRTRSVLPRAFCRDRTETSLISAAEETKP